MDFEDFGDQLADIIIIVPFGQSFQTLYPIVSTGETKRSSHPSKIKDRYVNYNRH